MEAAGLDWASAEGDEVVVLVDEVRGVGVRVINNVWGDPVTVRTEMVPSAETEDVESVVAEVLDAVEGVVAEDGELCVD